MEGRKLNELSEVRAQIGKIVEQLITIRYQMLGVQASLPASSLEISLEDLDADPDAPTEIRTVIGNCINDSLDPLIRDLLDLAKFEHGAHQTVVEVGQG
jgi:hypothetical protein